MADPSEPKPNEIDADNLSRLLELELIQKRATWKQAGERYRSFRAARIRFSLCPDRRLLGRRLLCFHARQQAACKSTDDFRRGALMSV